MSAEAIATRSNRQEVLTSFGRRNMWVIALLGLLAALLIFTKLIQPSYGVAGVQGLGISILPLAFAAVAQAVVVIGAAVVLPHRDPLGRGPACAPLGQAEQDRPDLVAGFGQPVLVARRPLLVDLSIGAVMALISVIAATLMEGQSGTFGVGVVVAVLLLGVLIGTVNGSLVVITRVPDIVVTLAMSFVWAGCALLVRSAPGGAASPWLLDLVIGPFVNAWIPKAAIVLLVIVGIIWIPVSRSRLGLSLYAVGGNQLAAFRSGVPIGRTKITAYALTGLFAALAGLSLTASTSIGTPVPGPYTLESVAAAVLGGVSLAGGRGGVFGPIVAVIVLQIIQNDMTFLNFDPNYALVAQGVILIGVLVLGSVIEIRRSRR